MKAKRGAGKLRLGPGSGEAVWGIDVSLMGADETCVCQVEAKRVEEAQAEGCRMQLARPRLKLAGFVYTKGTLLLLILKRTRGKHKICGSGDPTKVVGLVCNLAASISALRLLL